MFTNRSFSEAGNLVLKIFFFPVTIIQYRRFAVGWVSLHVVAASDAAEQSSRDGGRVLTAAAAVLHNASAATHDEIRRSAVVSSQLVRRASPGLPVTPRSLHQRPPSHDARTRPPASPCRSRGGKNLTRSVTDDHTWLQFLVHGQVTIIFVVSVCLFVQFSQTSLIRFGSN